MSPFYNFQFNQDWLENCSFLQFVQTEGDMEDNQRPILLDFKTVFLEVDCNHLGCLILSYKLINVWLQDVSPGIY